MSQSFIARKPVADHRGGFSADSADWIDDKANLIA
jgi:hypothetical protein